MVALRDICSFAILLKLSLVATKTDINGRVSSKHDDIEILVQKIRSDPIKNSEEVIKEESKKYSETLKNNILLLANKALSCYNEKDADMKFRFCPGHSKKLSFKQAQTVLERLVDNVKITYSNYFLGISRVNAFHYVENISNLSSDNKDASNALIETEIDRLVEILASIDAKHKFLPLNSSEFENKDNIRSKGNFKQALENLLKYSNDNIIIVNLIKKQSQLQKSLFEYIRKQVSKLKKQDKKNKLSS